ncbi:MAG: Na+/H+ antiporter subunit E [Acidobacteriota bacterium]
MAESLRTRAVVLVFLSVLGLWFLWSGHLSFSHPLLLVFGVLSALLVTGLCWRMGLLDEETMPLQLLPRGLAYAPWLLWQILLSCIDVLRRGLSPRLDIDPTVLTVEGSQETDLGLVVYAHSITLTPGTVSIDSDAGAHTIKVHTISKAGAEALVEGEMDRRVHRVEGASKDRAPQDKASKGQTSGESGA